MKILQRLVINKLGPIEHCELDCSDFMTFTGFQASGKSTISKCIYFFRTIKDDILNLAAKQALDIVHDRTMPALPLRRILESFLREKFLRIFGSSWGMENDMFIEYFYTDTVSIKVRLKDETVYSTPNYIWVELSANLIDFLATHNKYFQTNSAVITEESKRVLQKELATLFNDEFSVVYIPAGRSMITLLSTQLSYIYSTMEDAQKRTLDYCTQDYLERILKLKPEFEYGLSGLINREQAQKDFKQVTKKAMELINETLRGSYQYTNGEERILLDEKKYVKINFSSSGQQESVWILNLLFYYLTNKKPVLFIIEEPESHLFPQSQKYITELISLVFNQGHRIVVTTHSPYVLGTLNNMLYANFVSSGDATISESEIETVIPKMLWLQQSRFAAWFVKNGEIENCVDEDLGLIQNEKIDEISKVINQDFDKIFEISTENG